MPHQVFAPWAHPDLSNWSHDTLSHLFHHVYTYFYIGNIHDYHQMLTSPPFSPPVATLCHCTASKSNTTRCCKVKHPYLLPLRKYFTHSSSISCFYVLENFVKTKFLSLSAGNIMPVNRPSATVQSTISALHYNFCNLIFNDYRYNTFVSPFLMEKFSLNCLPLSSSH